MLYLVFMKVGEHRTCRAAARHTPGVGASGALSELACRSQASKSASGKPPEVHPIQPKCSDPKKFQCLRCNYSANKSAGGARLFSAHVRIVLACRFGCASPWGAKAICTVDTQAFFRVVDKRECIKYFGSVSTEGHI